jgi:hypothetical protein
MCVTQKVWVMKKYLIFSLNIISIKNAHIDHVCVTIILLSSVIEYI